MRKIAIVGIFMVLAACTKDSNKPDSSDPAVFFKSARVFCTTEKDGKAVADAIDRYEDVFVFERDNTLRFMSFDLDGQQRLQFNSKGLPKVKEIEKVTFRVAADKLFFKAEGSAPERESKFKRTKSKVDGREVQCFELAADSTVHCPCTTPESN